MKIFATTARIAEVFPTPILTMGNFDGVHLGHQHLFRLVQARAQQLGGTAMVLTFEPHPQKILFPDKEFTLINRMAEKIEIMRAIGIEVLICVAFTRAFAAQDPKAFVRDVLVQTLHVHEIYVGENSRFGQAQAGTPEALARWGAEFGFRVTIVPRITHHGVPVSSTNIRQLLRQGCVAEAARLLNRPYALDGAVIAGKQRGGKLLGCPTANIDVQHELIPRRGVYLCRAVWETRAFPAVLNIGTNPTFHDDDRQTVEVHLLDAHENLYGQPLKVIFLKRLRDEIAFAAPQALMNQIQADLQAARAYFRDHVSSCST